MPSKPEVRIQELHLTLPPAPKPVAKYKTAVLAGNILYVSGHGPAKIDAKSPVQGRVGADLTLEQGKDAAILKARVNLALKRVTVEWTEGTLRPPEMLLPASVLLGILPAL